MQPVVTSGAVPRDRHEIEDWLIQRIARLRDVAPEQVDPGESFLANGLSSTYSVALTADLAALLGVALPDTLPWQFPSVARFAAEADNFRRLAGEAASPDQT
jgi:hypothetical protein